MWDICADCTEEFVSNEVIRVVLPPLLPQNHFIIELNSSYTLWIVELLNHAVKPNPCMVKRVCQTNRVRVCILCVLG